MQHSPPNEMRGICLNNIRQCFSASYLLWGSSLADLFRGVFSFISQFLNQTGSGLAMQHSLLNKEEKIFDALGWLIPLWRNAFIPNYA